MTNSGVVVASGVGDTVPAMTPSAHATFDRVRPGTFWASVWTHARGTMRMRGPARSWADAATMWIGAVVGIAGPVVTIFRAMLLGWAWQSDAGHVVLLVGRRDSLGRWTVDVALVLAAVALSWWTYPRTQPWGQALLVIGWAGLAIGALWMRRRTPRATWVVGGISARGRSAGVLVRAAQHVHKLGEPGEVVTTRAATDRHVIAYRRLGFVSTDRDARTMIAVIPERDPTTERLATSSSGAL